MPTFVGMILRVTFLGTAAAAPTAERTVSATLLQRGAQRFLIDCGEGTARQLQFSYAGLADIDTVLLTHLHADHWLGLPGLIKAFSARNRTARMTVYGPPGTWMLLNTMQGVIGPRTFEVKVVEFEGGEGIYGLDGYRMTCYRTDHRLYSLGWVLEEDDRPGRFDAAAAAAQGVPNGPLLGQLQKGETVTLEDGRSVSPDGLVGKPRPGRTIVLTGDTRPTERTWEQAQNADLLVHEATFLDSEQREAIASGHSTVREAAEVAQTANVKLLALTHLSHRYQDADILAAAQEVFPASVVPNDLDQIEVPYAERGLPFLIAEGGKAAGKQLPGATAAVASL